MLALLAILIIVILIIVFILLAMAQIPNDVSAAGLNDFTFPDNNNGRAVPILFGTLWLSGNIMFYGDLRHMRIRACA